MNDHAFVCSRHGCSNECQNRTQENSTGVDLERLEFLFLFGQREEALEGRFSGGGFFDVDLNIHSAT